MVIFEAAKKTGLLTYKLNSSIAHSPRVESWTPLLDETICPMSDPAFVEFTVFLGV